MDDEGINFNIKSKSEDGNITTTSNNLAKIVAGTNQELIIDSEGHVSTL